MANGQEVTIIDGSLDFSGGVNSYLVPTIASERNPNGLKRNQLSWINNGTVRGGGITQRASWLNKGKIPESAIGLYQGCFTYEPDSEEPYIIASIGGHIWRIDPDDPESAVDLSVQFSEPGATERITDQVQVLLTHIAGGALPALIPTATTAELGTSQLFWNPGPGGSVRVPVSRPYTGGLGVGFTVIISGITWRIDATYGWVAQAPLLTMANPPELLRSYFCQAEQFLVIQAGDMITYPLIWDGSSLRRSLGLYGTGPLPAMSDYGVLAVLNVGAFAFGAVGTTTVLAITEPYVGNVGDYLNVVASYQGTGLTVGSRVTNYSYLTATFVVTAIGPGNSVTIRFTGYTTPVFVGYVFPASTPILKLNYVYPTPWTGEGTILGGTPEIPPATAMDYYMGRLWYAQGRTYSAGDIVGNQASGSQTYDFRDSVLKITENPMAIGGDGFTVPTNAGNIRAIKHSANINTTLGEGQLYIFTRRSIYALTVPVTRNDWIAADTDNQPRQTVVQITNGSVNDRSVAEQNGDLFFQSFEPAIRSLVLAVRYYEQWGNTPISINENRILKFNDRGLMQFASGISFDNRTLQLVLPEQTPVGVSHRAIVPLNFDVISTLENKLPPVWEGAWEGLNFLELVTGDFSGRQRAFAPVWDERTGSIQLWELSTSGRFEDDGESDDKRIVWFVEFPAFTWGDEFMLKKLVSAELWLDRLYGEVMFSMDYRVDGDPCWYKWHEWKRCTARDSCDDSIAPQCLYPQEYCESYHENAILPVPPSSCELVMGRPTTIGYQFQPRLTIKGFCRIRGILLKAEKVKAELYGSEIVC